MVTRRMFLSVAPGLALVGSWDGELRGGTNHGWNVDTRATPSIHTVADWRIQHTIDVSKDGIATVSTELSGDEIPRVVSLNRKHSTNVEILDGKDALTAGGGPFYRWDTSTQTAIEYAAELGHMNTSFVGSRSVSFRGRELMLVKNWDGGRDAVPKNRLVTINPPDDWSVASPGIERGTNTYELAPDAWHHDMIKEFFAVGDFTVRTASVDGAELRLVALPAAEPPDMDELESVLANVLPVVADLFGDTVTYPRLGIIGPIEINGGVAGGTGNSHSFSVTDTTAPETAEIYNDRGMSVHVHELTHTFHRFSSPHWHQEGQAVYVAKLGLFEAGEISEDTFKSVFQNRIEKGGNQPKDALPSESASKQGGMIYAGLDMDVRARTDGAEDVGSYLSRVNDQRSDRNAPPTISREDSIEALREITGVDYTPFFERFVDTPDYPRNVLGDRFSLTDPVTTWGFDFEIASVDAEETTIQEGEEGTVSATIRNASEYWGTDYVDLVVDDEVVDSEKIALDPGATGTVEFVDSFERPGEYSIDVDGASAPAVSVEGRSLVPGQAGFGVGSAAAAIAGATGYLLYREGADEP